MRDGFKSLDSLFLLPRRSALTENAFSPHNLNEYVIETFQIGWLQFASKASSGNQQPKLYCIITENTNSI